MVAAALTPIAGGPPVVVDVATMDGDVGVSIHVRGRCRPGASPPGPLPGGDPAAPVAPLRGGAGLGRRVVVVGRGHGRRGGIGVRVVALATEQPADALEHPGHRPREDAGLALDDVASHVAMIPRRGTG
jgi:hypothetical protein